MFEIAIVVILFTHTSIAIAGETDIYGNGARTSAPIYAVSA